MTITYRVPAPEDIEPFMAPAWRGFGHPTPDADTVADERMLWEPARSIGALDGDDWVGCTGTFTMDLTVPGGARVKAGGVTMVGVAATHRRQGILTELMRRQLEDIADASESVAVLTASEALIYGRFGYGLATRGCRLQLDPRHSRLRPEAPLPSGGRFRQVTVDEGRTLLPGAYERVREARPGSVSRSHAWWETHAFLDRPAHRDGGGSLGVLVHEDAGGSVDGWALHRTEFRWPDRLPHSTLRVEDILAADPAVHLGLWRCLLDHDLNVEVDVLHGPLDDPIRWALVDTRRLRSSEITDWLWLRILDVPAALTPRRWGGPGHLVIEVVDGFRPASGGRFLVEADADGCGSVSRSDLAPGLVIGAEELGAVALGGVSLSTLARVGRIAEERAGTLSVADSLFATDVAPYCCTMF